MYEVMSIDKELIFRNLNFEISFVNDFYFNCCKSYARLIGNKSKIEIKLFAHYLFIQFVLLLAYVCELYWTRISMISNTNITEDCFIDKQ